MKKYSVLYEGGTSRLNPAIGVDYMIAHVLDQDGDPVELYAEENPLDYIPEEDRDLDPEELYQKYYFCDCIPLLYYDLKNEIIRRAAEVGITEDQLEF